ncbi:phenylalanine--tRNA ligase subunit alpha [Candidatus Neptunochlamydia vexilliferae]|uniref:Phenylalanine--tRNA ligase alpha subunit n=1 Tax=Candidatus Neptunichlamydia vexilliferae TaxID=1651774 RepID=A0ABS0AX27_9BACT|nr:phenylalanine--tRNA ligase subunit alpha [Candidatus Neptunochlamydia vexilliferae]MBF5058678.1 Phenylalanine--tRNA ligase alpha subunit [Candidatus Neptunochlamydia vexilliferae]
MKERIEDLRQSFKSEIEEIDKVRDLEALRIKYLGKKSPIQALMQDLRSCSQEERPEMGKLINTLKQEVSLEIDAHHQTLKEKELSLRLTQEKVDVTLPGRRPFLGKEHPLSQMEDEVIDILIGMGFSVQECPEIESEYYNYGGLNYPPDHPARDMQDTFYITPDILLRSHTTSIQQHMMENSTPPIRILAAGKCYRNETITARSHVFFHQIDTLYIDKGVTFADLLATKEEFYAKVFKRKIELRVRPSYFPFVEPGMEVDIKCTACGGSGCQLCKHTGWLEVAGAGMVHPNVLKAGGIDPEVYSGYAWGGGIERLFMLRHGISDIRLFTENDTRFLSQFA